MSLVLAQVLVILPDMLRIGPVTWKLMFWERLGDITQDSLPLQLPDPFSPSLLQI